MTSAIRDSLAQVQELLGRATPGPWIVDMHNDVTANGEDIARDAGNFGYEENTANIVLIAEAVNFLRAHGQELMKMLDRHGAGDADRSAELTTAWMAGAESVRDQAARDAEDAARWRAWRELGEHEAADIAWLNAGEERDAALDAMQQGGGGGE